MGWGRICAPVRNYMKITGGSTFAQSDEQRGRRPIFIATLRAVTSWLFFRVAHSSRINLDMLVARALKNSQLAGGE
jgi:hypothetical protein